MFKQLLSAAFALLFAGSVFAAGPAQIWRLDVTGTDDGIVEIAEIELRAVAGGSNVTNLIEISGAEVSLAATGWTFVHSMGTQTKLTSADVVAFAVDVVAPGDWFVNTVTGVLSQRAAVQYVEYEYVSGPTGGEPLTPEIDDIYYDNQLLTFAQWNGAVWASMTVTTTTSALPQPDVVTPDSITIVNEPMGANLPGGVNNSVDVAFPQDAVGAISVYGITFDTPAVNRPGSSIPPIELLENRPAAAAWDGNKGSWFKSTRAPTERTPLSIQYTYWVGDPDSYPTVVEYAITAKNSGTGPRSWRLMYYSEGAWKQADQQAGIIWEDGQTRAFPID